MELLNEVAYESPSTMSWMGTACRRNYEFFIIKTAFIYYIVIFLCLIGHILQVFEKHTLSDPLKKLLMNNNPFQEFFMHCVS